jgi:hypothetical protein
LIPNAESRDLHNKLKISFLSLTLVFSAVTAAHANTRTLETRFALSADARSEFSKQFPLLSPGRIVIEATWTSLSPDKLPSTLTVNLIQPDGTILASKKGNSVLRFDYRATDQDIEKLTTTKEPKWTVKIFNDASTDRTEVSGTLRITIPAASRSLEDTQFTLLGSSNAQEIPFNVPAPGRVQVEVTWTPDVLSNSSEPVSLVVSFIHPGESRTYARRQGASPISVEHQVTEQTLDLGARWIVRVQNDTQTKVNGRVRITYTPSL